MSGKPHGGRGGAGGDRAAGSGNSGVAARRAAIDALVRIEETGAYANLLLPKLLERKQLERRDRAFVTELVYGTTRMRRACDFVVDRFLLTEVEPQVRAALRLGAYQLEFLGTPRHAAVGATVGAVKGRGRGVVNAVLRKAADAGRVAGEDSWPSGAVRLSYPDWLVDTLTADLGTEAATAALEVMNRAAVVNERDDGYVQDPASQEVVERLAPAAGELVIDLCAAPGGKATAIAGLGARVVAADVRPARAGLIAANARSTDTDVAVVTADGTRPPFRPESADAVLVDAPCSGIGSLRRRPDARWRLDVEAPERLAALQVDLVLAGLDLVKPGGRLLYSVCTLTAAETHGVRAVLADRLGDRLTDGGDLTIGEVSMRLPTDDADGMAHLLIQRR
ncbi:MAG: transcription antitermination factor NusB [Acidimicrobiales bacterium]